MPSVISLMDTSGTIPLTTNTSKATGGVITAIQTLQIQVMQNHTGSNPNDITMGKKMGMVSRKREPASKKKPMITSNTYMVQNTTHLESPKPTTYSLNIMGSLRLVSRKANT